MVLQDLDGIRPAKFSLMKQSPMGFLFLFAVREAVNIDYCDTI